MAHIVYAWEMGGGYGHIGSFLPLAESLHERGHRITLILKMLSAAGALIGHDDFELLQAPIGWPDGRKVRPILSYPDLLLQTGFAEENALLARVRAWQNLFRRLDPELLILDHAPTALLATHGWPVKRILFGSGFFVPPKIQPMPNLRPWMKVSESQLLERETRVLHVIQRLTKRLGMPEPDRLWRLFEVDQTILRTYRELDHYPERQGGHYYGAVTSESGVEIPWPAGDGPKVFGYLNATHPNIDHILQQLVKASRWTRILLHVRGLPHDKLAKLQSPRLIISPQPVCMGQAAQCDVAINHASHGTVVAMLLAGRPQLLLPTHLEQLLVARNVERLGACRFFFPENRQPEIGKTLKQLINDAGFKHKAEKFAAKYGNNTESDHASDMMDCCARVLMPGCSRSPSHGRCRPNLR